MHYLLKKVEHAGVAESRHLTLGLLEDLRVVWAEQQFDKLRVKRDPDGGFQRNNGNGVYTLQRTKGVLRRNYIKRLLSGEHKNIVLIKYKICFTLVFSFLWGDFF